MNIEEMVKEHIEHELMTGPQVVLELDTSLVGVVDSSGVLELAMWTESTFGFSVEFDQISPEDFGSVRKLSDWIRRSLEHAKG